MTNSNDRQKGFSESDGVAVAPPLLALLAERNPGGQDVDTPDPADSTKSEVVRVMESMQIEGAISQDLYNRVRGSLGVLGFDTTQLDTLFKEYISCNSKPIWSQKDPQTIDKEYELAAKIALLLEKARTPNGRTSVEYLQFLDSYYQILGRCSLEYSGQDKNNGFSILPQRIDQEIVERVAKMISTRYVDAKYSMLLAKIVQERGLMPLIEKRYGKIPEFSEKIQLLDQGGLSDGDIEESLGGISNLNI